MISRSQSATNLRIKERYDATLNLFPSRTEPTTPAAPATNNDETQKNMRLFERRVRTVQQQIAKLTGSQKKEQRKMIEARLGF